MASSARLDELKKKFDDNPRRYFAPLANEYRKLGDLVQAIGLCRTHLPNQPGHISGNIVLAQALYESRELGEARVAFEAALDLDPENLIALRFLGDIAREEGSPGVAHGWYQRVLEADPRNDEISQLLREVQAEEAAARSELASRPTPPSVQSVSSGDSGAATDAAPAATVAEELTVDAAEEVTFNTADDFTVEAPEEAAVSSEVAAEPPLSAAAAQPIEELDLPSFDGAFDPPPAAAPAFAALDDEDPFFSEEAMGEFEAAAEPSLDDWFRAEPVAENPAAAPEAELFLPDLSSASELPAPAEVEAAQPDEKFSWRPTAPEAPVAEVAAEPAIDFSADPEGNTTEFTIEAAAPVAEPVELFEEPTTVDETPEETFEPVSWASADVSEPVAETPEPVEAPSYDWSAEDVPSEPATPWDAATTEMPSAWDSALAPEQLAPVHEEPPQPQPNPLLGRTPRFEHAIPEEPPAPFVTETMAELYLQQGFTEEGLAIYRQLLRNSPNDESLQRRVASLESSGESSVLDGASEAPSVRAFFARFATRARRAPEPGRASPNDDGAHASFGGVASADEAMTQPDEPSSLTQVFAARAVSTADAQAAATLASAFGIPSTSGASDSDGELSLGRLFRDVEAHSPGAVTSAGFADAAPGAPDTRQASDVESHADIEQFTAWLEGLKKK